MRKFIRWIFRRIWGLFNKQIRFENRWNDTPYIIQCFNCKFYEADLYRKWSEPRGYCWKEDRRKMAADCCYYFDVKPEVSAIIPPPQKGKIRRLLSAIGAGLWAGIVALYWPR